MKRRLIAWSGPAAWLAAATGPLRAAEPGIGAGEIVVGQNITLQNGRNVYGGEVMVGVKAALEEVNRAGGVRGRRVVLRTLDDDNSADKAEANARSLVEQGVFALFGSIEGGPSTAVMKAAVATGVPFIGPMAGSPGLRRPHQPLVFPVRAEHKDEFRALIEHGQRVGKSKVALFHADSGVGREHLANVELLCNAAKMAFGGGIPFKGDITDDQLGGVVGTLQDRGVDLVLNHCSAGVYGRLIKQAHTAPGARGGAAGAGRRIAFWGVNSGSTPLAASLGPLAHGMVFAQIVPSPWSGKTALVRDYQAAMARVSPPVPPSYGTLEGFLTARVLVLALRAAGPAPTRTGLLAALANFEADLGGVRVVWKTGAHTGISFVDLALVGRDGRFVQ
jgi:branched-chain amino acid transport system substrate-binding protein